MAELLSGGGDGGILLLFLVGEMYTDEERSSDGLV